MGQANIIKLSNLQALGNNIYQQQISPDSNWVVYRADHDTEDVRELYSVPINGSTDPIKLNGPVIDGGNIWYDYKISADSNHVVYRGEQDTDGIVELYSVPIDGSTPPTKLNQNLSSDEFTGYFHISSDGNRVVYTIDNEQSNVTGLYSVSIDGSAAPTKLNGIELNGSYIWGCQISADSSRVVFVAVQDYGSGHTGELYSVPITGNTEPIKLDDAVTNGGEVKSFKISNNSNRVIYIADDTYFVDELYSVPMDGSSSPTKLNDTQSKNVLDFQISPNSSSVIFRGTKYQVDELYSVSINGGVPPTKLNGTLVSGGDVTGFQISANSNHVVYRADQDTNDVNELYSIPVSGSTSPTKLNSTLVNGGDVRGFQISANSNHVVYAAEQDTENVIELYSVPIDRNSAPIQLNGILVNVNAYGSFQITADSNRVIYYSAQDMVDNIELYSVPINGSSAPIKLNGSLIGTANVWDDYQVSTDSNWVVYRANQSADYAVELYSVPVDGSIVSKQIDNPQASVGDVLDQSQISPDSNWAVYLADQDTFFVVELYKAPLNGSGTSTKLNGTLVGGGDVESFKISADSGWVVYLADQDSNGINELYSVPIDNNTHSIKLNGNLSSGESIWDDYQISADSNRVVYRVVQDDGTYELYSVPIDGSAAPTKFYNAQVGYFSYTISPDSNWVILHDDLDTAGIYELYSVPIDGSAAPIKLNDTLSINGDVENYQIGANSDLVVYLADQDTDNIIELYSVPIDGSAAPTKLNGALTSGGNVFEEFQISADGNKIVYSADQDTQSVKELYSVPTDGSAVPTKLNEPLVEGGSVVEYQISDDSSFVVYRADQDIDNIQGLFSVSIDGSTPLTQLADPQRSVQAFQISGDNRLVAYKYVHNPEFYSVPVDGSTQPLKLGGSLVNEYLLKFEISADSNFVVYLIYHTVDSTLSLYSIPIQSNSTPTKLNGTSVGNGNMRTNYQLSNDSKWAIYVADQDIDGLDELYASGLTATFIATDFVYLPSIMVDN